MIINSTFKPAPWLKNPHLQTLWPKLLRPYPHIQTQRERIELPDGDFLDLNFTPANNGPIILVLHGLEGSLQSKYAAGILKALHTHGYRGVLMHFRSCSGEPNRLAQSYHSGATQDPQHILNLLQQRHPGVPIAAIGFSLGGNVLLKLLGNNPGTTPIQSAIAISVPFLLGATAEQLNCGFAKLYRRHLLQSLLQKIRHKHQHIQSEYLRNILTRRIRNLYEFDDKITAPLHGFKNADDYYTQCSSRQYLKTIIEPTLILHARDDPFMTTAVIPQEHELSSSITLEISEHGGHVGFVSGTLPGRCQYWLENRIIQFLDTTLKHSPTQSAQPS